MKNYKFWLGLSAFSACLALGAFLFGAQGLGYQIKNSVSAKTASASYGYAQSQCGQGVCLRYEYVSYSSGAWNVKVDYTLNKGVRGNVKINGNYFTGTVSKSGTRYTGYNVYPGTNYTIAFYNNRGRLLTSMTFRALSAPGPVAVCDYQSPPSGCYYDFTYADPVTKCGAKLVCNNPPVYGYNVPNVGTNAEGWLESFNTENGIAYVAGWAYDNGNYSSVALGIENTSTGQVSYFYTSPSSYRDDVANKLASKFGIQKPYANTAFKAYLHGLAAGTYRVKTATYNGKPFNVHFPASYPITVGIDHKLRVASPNGGEVWGIGTTQTIKWVDANPTNSTSQAYTIHITRKDGGSYGIAATVYNTREYNWKVGQVDNGYGGYTALRPGSEYYVQIVKQYADGQGTNDQSDGSFTILDVPTPPQTPYIKVTSPNGGEKINLGSSHNITWQTNITSSQLVNIAITKASLGSGGTAYIAKGVANTGSYYWNTSASLITQPYSMAYLAAGSDYTISISPYDTYTYGSLGDASDSYFGLVSAAARTGQLINMDGTVYLVGEDGLYAFPDLATFNSWGFSFANVVVANDSERALSRMGVVPARLPGYGNPLDQIRDGKKTSVLNLVLDNASPYSRNLASGSTNQEVLRAKFSAAGKDVGLASVIVKVEGPARKAVKQISINDGGVMVGSQLYAYHDDGYSDLYSVNLPNLIVPVNSSKTLSVRVDLKDASIQGDMRFLINGLGWVPGQAPSQTNGLPVAGYTMRIEPAAVVLPDLQIKDITESSSYPDMILVTVCVNGPKSINDIKRENNRVANFPLKYLVYDSYGQKYEFTSNAGGGIEDMKNGECLPQMGMAIQSWHRTYWQATKKVTVVADPDNLIAESNEYNNQYTYQGSPAPYGNLGLEVMVNGYNSESVPAVPYNSQFTLSWSSTGASRCEGYGYFIPSTDGTVWARYPYTLSLSGSKILYARHDNSGFVNPLYMNIYCYDASGKSVNKTIQVPVYQ